MNYFIIVIINDLFNCVYINSTYKIYIIIIFIFIYVTMSFFFNVHRKSGFAETPKNLARYKFENNIFRAS